MSSFCATVIDWSSGQAVDPVGLSLDQLCSLLATEVPADQTVKRIILVQLDGFVELIPGKSRTKPESHLNVSNVIPDLLEAGIPKELLEDHISKGNVRDPQMNPSSIFIAVETQFQTVMVLMICRC